ncbi:lysoplasmalogenase [Alteromonas sp. D210916BOD_24]|uniref:lysoplasmalogenase n=1 Tax=Alteromonas sp. D210916BOD_24 TaxID=3157618 RepID=UPI00399C923D
MSHRFSLIYVILAGVYLASLPYTPYAGQFAIKGLPIALLILCSAMALRGSQRLVVMLALLASLAGDVVLALPIENQFVFGLLCFFVAHIVYVISFVYLHKVAHRSALDSKAVSLKPALSLSLLCLAIACFALYMAIGILPAAGAMLYPVVAYLCIITTMSVCAVLFTQSALIICGAIIFMLSDAAIAQSVFKEAIPLSDYFIMLTYYVAQFCLTAGLINAFSTNAKGVEA